MDGETMRSLGKLLSEKRQKLDLTQKDIAEMLETSESYISKLERGDYLHSISAFRAMKLAKILKMGFPEFAKKIGLD